MVVGSILGASPVQDHTTMTQTTNTNDRYRARTALETSY